MLKSYIFIGATSLIVIGAVAYVFISFGSPFTERAIRFDQARLSDLSSLSSGVQNYYSINNKLPSTLDDLLKASSSPYSYRTLTKIPKDPESSKEYSYEVTASSAYKLCATFSTDSAEVQKSQGSSGLYDYYNYTGSTSNKHKKGYDCITYTIQSYIVESAQKKLTECTSTPATGGVRFDVNVTAELAGATSSRSVNLKWEPIGAMSTLTTTYYLSKNYSCTSYSQFAATTSSTKSYTDIPLSGKNCYKVEARDMYGTLHNSNISCVDVP